MLAPVGAVRFHERATVAHVNRLQDSSYMRIIGIMIGLAVAAFGGVMAYRAYFTDPSAAIVITDSNIREVPNYIRVASGILLVAIGAAIAFFAARRRPL